MATTLSEAFMDGEDDDDDDDDDNNNNHANVDGQANPNDVGDTQRIQGQDMIIKGAYTPEDRDNDILSLYRMARWTMFITACALVVSVSSFLCRLFLKYATIPASLVLMALWTILFIVTTTGIFTKRRLLVFYAVMVIFLVLPLLNFQHVWPIFAVLALGIVCWQVTWLVGTFWSYPRAETESHESFFGALNVICATATLTSTWFIFTSVLAWPSSLSLEAAVASFFCFAYAAFVASKVHGARGKTVDTDVVCTSYAVPAYMETRNGWCTAVLLMLGNVAVSITFVCLWPPDYHDYRERDRWTVGALLPIFFGIHALIYQNKLLRAYQFYIQSDGAILVETFFKTYVYYKAVHASLDSSRSELPEQSALCHVYCARKGVPRVEIELTGGRLLYLAPERPVEFTEALVSVTADAKA